MTVYDMIQKLSHYPADTKIVLGFDWGEPVIDDEYLCLEGAPGEQNEPCLNITNTPESKARVSERLAAATA
jgi:hypothetical protein